MTGNCAAVFVLRQRPAEPKLTKVARGRTADVFDAFQQAHGRSTPMTSCSESEGSVVLDAAYSARPERFVRKPPQPPALP
jgi:hypothetical protein